MARRLNTLKGNISFFLLFLIVGVLSHIDLGFTDELRFRFYPIPLMITVYLGYKLGRRTGLVAGISISSIATLFVLFKGEEQVNWIKLIFDGVYLSSSTFFGPSIEYIILAGTLGWLSGFLFDCLDNALAKEGLCIDNLIPQRRKSILLRTLQSFNKRFAFLHSDKSQGKSENGQKVKRKWPRKILIHPAAILLAFLNISLYLQLSEHISTTICPQYLADAGILILALHSKGGRGVRLVFEVWIISFFILLALPEFAPDSWEITYDVEPPYNIFSIQNPAHVVGLAILAWWGGKIGKIIRNPEKRAALLRLWTTYCRKQNDEAQPGYLIVFIILVLVIGIELQYKALFLCYSPLILLLLTGTLWSIRHNRIAVSNRIIATLIWFTLLSGYWYSPEHVSVKVQSLDFMYLVILGFIPLVVGKMELSSLSRCRSAMFGILVACVLTDIYVRGSMPLFPVLTVSIYEHELIIAGWILTLLAFEASSRLVCYLVNK